MACKQRSWRRSNKALSLMFLLSLPATSLVASEDLNGRRHPAFVASLTAGMTDEQLRQSIDEKPFSWPVFASEEEKERTFLHGRSYREIEESFEGAQPRVRQIVDHLRDPRLLNRPKFRNALFVGPIGSGKSGTALAVPYKLGGSWECHYKSALEFKKEHRDGSTQKLLEYLNGLKRAVKIGGKKVVVIFDEIDRLTDNAGNTNYDTDSSSGALWTFFDTLGGLHGFFFIGITNDDTKMPDQLKNRFERRRFMFERKDGKVFWRGILRDKIVDSTTVLDTECTDQVLDGIVEKMAGWPIRSYENIAEEVACIAAENGQPADGVKIVKKAYLEQAIKFLIQSRAESKIGEPQLSQEERRHQEVLRQQTLHHVQSTLIQLDVQSSQKEQVSKGVNGSIGVNGNAGVGVGANACAGAGVSVGGSASVTSSPGIAKETAQEIAAKRLLKSQMQVYQEAMQEDKKEEKKSDPSPTVQADNKPGFVKEFFSSIYTYFTRELTPEEKEERARKQKEYELKQKEYSERFDSMMDRREREKAERIEEIKRSTLYDCGPMDDDFAEMIYQRQQDDDGPWH